MSEEYIVPKDLYYSDSHEWVKIEGDKARIGITDYAVKQLEEITRLTFEVNEGDEISQGSTIGVVESYKAAEDIYSPLSGKVVEVNREVDEMGEANYSLLTEDPYGKGWLIVIIPSKLDEELKKLMKGDEYKEYISKL